MLTNYECSARLTPDPEWDLITTPVDGCPDSADRNTDADALHRVERRRRRLRRDLRRSSGPIGGWSVRLW